MNPKIIPLSAAVDAEISSPSSDVLLSGTPRTSVANYFTDASGQFFAGKWSSTRGKWRVRYTENELCVMTSGRVILSDNDGASHSFSAGEAFIIPAGFSGTWETVEDCTKIYAIFEKRP